MVAIIENWARIRGRVVARGPSPRGDRAVLRVAVASVEDLPGWPNLMADAAGSEVEVELPEALIEALGLERGVELRARVRRGPKPGLVFAHTREVERVGAS